MLLKLVFMIDEPIIFIKWLKRITMLQLFYFYNEWLSEVFVMLTHSPLFIYIMDICSLYISLNARFCKSLCACLFMLVT